LDRLACVSPIYENKHDSSHWFPELKCIASVFGIDVIFLVPIQPGTFTPWNQNAWYILGSNNSRTISHWTPKSWNSNFSLSSPEILGSTTSLNAAAAGETHSGFCWIQASSEGRAFLEGSHTSLPVSIFDCFCWNLNL
jgi:hypothetical protein